MGASFGLAALHIAALALSEQRDCVQAHISMQSSSTACEVLPSMLARLLKQKAWQSPSVAKSLADVLYTVHMDRQCGKQLHSLTRKCLLTVHANMELVDTEQLSMVVSTQ